jgi:hypothetical protein
LIPDVIDGDATENDEMLEAWRSDLRGVPIWHMHEPIERLKRLCMTWQYVALGSSGEWPTPGKGQWWARMSDAMDAICDDTGRPPCRLHGLRMLNPKVFTRLPLASADSMSAVRRGNSIKRFGMYPAPTAAQRSEVVAERIESNNSAPTWTRQNQYDLFEDAAERGPLFADKGVSRT